jgi:probable rRNA maturation factor
MTGQKSAMREPRDLTPQAELAQVIELELDLDNVSGRAIPHEALFRAWIEAALNAAQEVGAKELSVRVVDNEESRALNYQYRQSDKPTNVLSFPCELPEGVDCPLLGDLVICAPVVEKEALEQGKDPEHHWAHMVVHGCLHLLGYDHIDADDAVVMEALEVQILHSFGVADPYHLTE